MLVRNFHADVVRRWFRPSGALLVAAALALAACATTALPAPSVQRLVTTHYAPTQTVDVLHTPPTRAFTRIARLTVTDPTGTASVDQLVSQLTASAQSLGANALIVGQPSRAGGGGIAFNPAGGQMQHQAGDGAMTLTATAIRYDH